MKVLCICHANICRSFMAQEFFKHLVPEGEFFSRGLYADPSFLVPSKVINALAKHHISFAGHTSTPLTPADLAGADLIFCMERTHEEYLLDHYPQYTDKIWLLAEFAQGSETDIEDPISLEGRMFEKTAEKLFKICQAAAKRIAQNRS